MAARTSRGGLVPTLLLVLAAALIALAPARRARADQPVAAAPVPPVAAAPPAASAAAPAPLATPAPDAAAAEPVPGADGPELPGEAKRPLPPAPPSPPAAGPATLAAPDGEGPESRSQRIERFEASLDDPHDDPEDGWALEEMRFRFAAFFQDGEGLQSRAGPVNGRGSEEAWILEPLALARIRQTKRLHHEIYLPIDVVSAASPDALDAVATASRTNEAFAIDVNSTYQASPMIDVGFRYGFHIEEPLRSFDAGPSFTFHLFENNSVFTLSGVIVTDGFDPISPTGHDAGFASRSTFGGNLSYAQVLSPTTLLDASVGTTEQWGTLENTWNSVIVRSTPDADGETTYSRNAEKFPASRNRDAAFVRISQHIPQSHTTFKASYRLYWDTNKSIAHTAELQVFQYFVPWLYARVHGRYHHQDAPDFWVKQLQAPFDKNKTFRTSDSDLETLHAGEGGLKLVFDRSRAPAAARGSDSFDVGYLRYQRTNGLHVDFASVGYARSF